ncbi:MAG: 3-dehydroquinate synthase [Gemmatimonadota bacterium]
MTHAAGTYRVLIEPGGMRRLPDLASELLGSRRLAAITDDTVRPLFPAWLHRADWPETVLSFPPGETHKTRETWAALSDELLHRGYGRDSAIIAVGGGVVGDVAGFVAATYARGVPFLQVPTTLLAMLDAAVGGKTGVDTPHGKNLIGAFHPPAGVLVDPLVLGSLDAREYRAGLAEAVKHGLVADLSYFEWIEHHADALLSRDAEAVTRLVTESVAIKARVVSEDEHETGRRATLNAGHTVAHAIEQATAYGMLHGEAVSLGLVAECGLAEVLGLAPAGTRARVTALLARLGLPVRLPPTVDPDRLLAAMRLDKKNRAGAVRFALPLGLGVTRARNGSWTVTAPDHAIRVALSVLA